MIEKKRIWFLFCCSSQLHGLWVDVGKEEKKKRQSISCVRIRLCLNKQTKKKNAKTNSIWFMFVGKFRYWWHTKNKFTVKLTYNQMDSHTHSLTQLYLNSLSFCGVAQIIAFDWALLFAIKLLLWSFFLLLSLSRCWIHIEKLHEHTNEEPKKIDIQIADDHDWFDTMFDTFYSSAFSIKKSFKCHRHGGSFKSLPQVLYTTTIKTIQWQKQ